MNEQEAINVLVQGVLIAQKAGVYSLQDAAIIYDAIKVVVPGFAENTKTEAKNEIKDNQ